MKRKLLALTIGAAVLLSGTNMYAKPGTNENAKKGTVNMDRNVLSSSVIEPAGGGWWDHAFSSSSPWVHWSDYNHPSKEHKSSAGNSSYTVHSQWMPAANWSYATCEDSYTGNTANWNTQ